MAATAEDLREAYLTGRNSNNELTPDMLQKKGWASDRVLRVLNGLVEKRLCSYSKDKVTGKIRVKVREEEVAFAIRPLPPDDYAVYCAIENSGKFKILKVKLHSIAQIEAQVELVFGRKIFVVLQGYNRMLFNELSKCCLSKKN
jgi:hypothetical protein